MSLEQMNSPWCPASAGLVVGLVLLAAAQIVNTEQTRQGPGGSEQGGPPRDPRQPTETALISTT